MNTKKSISKEEFIFKYGLGSARNKKFLDEILNNTNRETDRGSVIIASSLIEDFLAECIKEILPFSSNTKINKLFKYPGILSSFSSKIEMAYCFGLFDHNITSSLHILRDMRNECAHSVNSFDLSSNTQKLIEINSVGEGNASGIKQFAIYMQAQFKLKKITEFLNNDNISPEEQREIIESVIKDGTLIDAVRKPALKLEFITGLIQIQAIMEVQKNDFMERRRKSYLDQETS